MSICLEKQRNALQRCMLRKGPRIFGLLGKATPDGYTALHADEVSTSWALTAEVGCLRLERLSGQEEVTGEELFLPAPLAYDFGISGPNASPDLAPAVFGLYASELEQLVTVLRQGSFPVLGFSQMPLRCSISSCIIPACWPHVVTSNRPLYGNVVSLETFMRILVSSLPQGQLGMRFPSLLPAFKRMMKLMLWARPGLLYTPEALELTPQTARLSKV